MFCLATLTFASSVAAQTFSNAAPILINDNAPAALYPSTILISGLDPTLTYTIASVQLNNVSHTATGDMDVLLSGPNGFKTLLMSDNFGDLILNNVLLRFIDSAPIAMGNSGDLSSQEMAQFAGSTFDTSGFGQPRVNNGLGTFLCSNFGTGDTFASPAPTGPYTATRLSNFTATGAQLNGQAFSLFVTDDAALDNGQIAGGWLLSLTQVAIIPEPCTLFYLIGCVYVTLLFHVSKCTTQEHSWLG